MAEVSGILGRRIGRQIGIVEELAPVVARAAHAVAEVVRLRGGDDVDAFVEARRRVADLWEAIDEHRHLPTTDTSGGVSIAVSMGRIIAALDPDDTTAPRPDDDAVPDDTAADDEGGRGAGSDTEADTGPADGRAGDEPTEGGTDSTGPVDDPTAPRDTEPRR
jgi:hypothetical protein